MAVRLKAISLSPYFYIVGQELRPLKIPYLSNTSIILTGVCFRMTINLAQIRFYKAFQQAADVRKLCKAT